MEPPLDIVVSSQEVLCLILLGPKRRLGYLAQEYWVSQTL